MYSEEKRIELIERKYTRINSDSSGKYLHEITDRNSMTEKLLENYRHIKFNAKNSPSLILKYTEDMLDDTIRIQIENVEYKNINSFCQEQIEQVVKRVKNYPKYGPIYYRILQYRFLKKEYYTYEKIAKLNKTSKQNILQKKNEAIKIVSDILWDTPPSDIAVYFAEYQAKRMIDRTEQITLT